MQQRLHKIRDMADTAIHSSRGKDVLLYLVFVCVAFLFWVFLSLDSEVQRDYDVPIELESLPDSVTLIGRIPNDVSVVVQAKGSQLLRYSWGHVPPLKIKFGELSLADNALSLSKLKLEGRVRDYFGGNTLVMSMRPDSLYALYTTNPGVKVKLNVSSDIHPDPLYIINGPIRANVDSVRVFSVNDVPRTLTSVSTEMIVRSDLRDTMRYEVRIKPIAGMRIVPDKVVVTVPVEPLISKRRSIEVDVSNQPEMMGLITFPSRVEVSYLVPISSYNDDYPLKAYVDFDDLYEAQRSLNSKLKVRLSLIPSHYYNVSVQPDSVEYIIEQHR